MAGGQERVLRRRIRSVQSTKKITRAMELIAASRIVKAQQRVAAARPYSEQITTVIRNLASAGAASSSPLLTPRDEVRRVGYVVITGDRGLAGGYNSSVIRAAERELQAEMARGRQYALFLVGKKAQGYFGYRGYDIEATFTGMSDQPTYEDARAVADAVVRRFNEGSIDRVDLAYTQFLSVGSQRVDVRRFMPLETAQLTEGPGGVATDGAASNGSGGAKADYEYEPAPAAILDRLLPRYVESRLFAALLDAAASEHAARQRAMKSATDNAEDLITALQRIANRARQETITTEIMEIVGGAEALSAAAGGEADLIRDNLDLPDLFEANRGQQHFARRIDQERT